MRKRDTVMKKALTLVLAILLCVGIFAGCSKKDSTIVLEGLPITAENASPYEGVYLENGDVEQVSSVYAMKFTNTGDQSVQNAQLVFSDGTNELVFFLEMLPAGKSVTVVEANKLAATKAEIHYVDGTVTYIDAGLENVGCVEVTGDGPVQVRNTTEDALPLVRIFYRKTDGNGNLIGGPCYSFMVDGIEAGATVDAEAEFWDESCEVVTVLVINE